MLPIRFFLGQLMHRQALFLVRMLWQRVLHGNPDSAVLWLCAGGQDRQTVNLSIWTQIPTFVAPLLLSPDLSRGPPRNEKMRVFLLLLAPLVCEAFLPTHVPMGVRSQRASLQGARAASMQFKVIHFVNLTYKDDP
jgi:hypothetical protein